MRNLDDQLLAKYLLLKRGYSVSLILNLIFPGTGFVYCNQFFIGYITFLVFFFFYIYAPSIAILVLFPMLILGTCIAVKKCNKDLFLKFKSRSLKIDKKGLEVIKNINNFKPINMKWANKIHPSGVKFKESGFPDFSPFSIKTIKVEGLTGDNETDKNLATKAAGLDKKPNGYTWHHVEDRVTMQLIPSNIHDAVRHTGGASFIRNNRYRR